MQAVASMPPAAASTQARELEEVGPRSPGPEQQEAVERSQVSKPAPEESMRARLRQGPARKLPEQQGEWAEPSVEELRELVL